jgi:ubiquinone/menaquinone biosynthesis C-methylase UbiE
MTIDANRSWTRFWDTEHSVYVSPRHLDSHYRHIADDILRVLPHSEARFLDHGCGEAIHARRIAAACGALLLCDAAPNLRARLSERFADEPKIEVLAPNAVEMLPERSLDLVVANSLVQYLSRDTLSDLLHTWRRLLKPDGRLVIADVITPEQTAMTDAAALLRFAARSGFLTDAAFGLVRTFFSDYRRLRTQLGLTRYSEAELLALVAESGLAGALLEPNFGYNHARLAIIARRTD